MKLLILMSLLITSLYAQGNEVVGSWHGQLSIQNTHLAISFHIKKTPDGYETLMDSPDQGALGIPTTSTSYKDNTLIVKIANLGAQFKGIVNDNTITGTFSQSGMDLPLVLTPQKPEKKVAQKRPQDPVKPYDYESQDIEFINNKANNIKLSGTLTLPNDIKNPAVAIMITGSGPQNRDQEIKVFNHRPFLVWSDYLTRNGIAVLRFDDRGVGQSQGSQHGATSEDFATDVEAAFAYLRSRDDVVDTSKIGLIGHSEGGFIAPMVAHKNNNVAFMVLLSGTGVDGAKILNTQIQSSLKLNGEPQEIIDLNAKVTEGTFDLIKQYHDSKDLNEKLTHYSVKMRNKYPDVFASSLTDEKIAAQIQTITTNWYLYFIRTDPHQFLSKVQCPTLAVNGELDIQVLADLNLNAIQNSLKAGNNKDFTIKKFESLNHLFQTAQTGRVDEYGKIEETVSPKVMSYVTQWINSRFGG